MKTLYVSDLDGTLLRSDQKTSEFTNQTINTLVEDGMLFSYATARSYHTAHKVTAGMTAAFPVILYNGAFILDNATGQMLLKNFFEKEEAVRLILELVAHEICPIVYAFVQDEEKFSYRDDRINPATREFIESRAGDTRDRPVFDMDALLAGDIFYIVCIDTPEKLAPFYEKYDPVYHCVYQRDIYSNEQWLEIMPQTASKSRAALQLKEYLGCERLVVFGDHVNDLDLFQIADEAYAVANAVPELKEAADAILASNNEDGVAHWLRQRFTKIIAACGNDCAACPRYVAHPYEKTDEELARTAELWMKIGYRDHIVSNEEISCTGCKPENWCRYRIVKCCAERNVANCGACEEYPCAQVKDCFAVTKSFEPQCREVCTKKEYEQLKKAFFEKEKNLDPYRSGKEI